MLAYCSCVHILLSMWCQAAHKWHSSFSQAHSSNYFTWELIAPETQTPPPTYLSKYMKRFLRGWCNYMLSCWWKLDLPALGEGSSRTFLWRTADVDLQIQFPREHEAKWSLLGYRSPRTTTSHYPSSISGMLIRLHEQLDPDSFIINHSAQTKHTVRS